VETSEIRPVYPFAEGLTQPEALVRYTRGSPSPQGDYGGGRNRHGRYTAEYDLGHVISEFINLLRSLNIGDDIYVLRSKYAGLYNEK